MTSPSEYEYEYAEVIRQTPAEVTPELIRNMWALFALAHQARGHQAPIIERDLAYGPDARHRLDVHTSRALQGPASVLVFVQGGGFVAGDKHTPGMPYYDHIGRWAVDRGIVGVTVNYRLAPDHTFPAGAEDVAAAVDWVRTNIAAHGGDPRRIVLAGHSAGAAHSAGYLAGHGSAKPDVAAAALLSGIYDLREAEKNELLSAYFGSDPSAYTAREALPSLRTCGIPLLAAVAELDPPLFQAQAEAVQDAASVFVRVGGHNHISEIVSLGVDDGPLGQPLLRFIEQHTARSAA
ncbi:alpha/beta hydrolase [Streptomyces sp. NPDC020794]|uniref:alpha/beta hydrolase n=1 Tax=unclassified Streptomyces TaxID=2593676 RepID=UPI0036E02404